MVNTKEYILKNFGKYSGVNKIFITCFDEWDGNKIKILLFSFINKSLVYLIEKEDLFDLKGKLIFQKLDINNLVKTDTILSISLQLTGYIDLPEKTVDQINKQSGFFSYGRIESYIGFREVIESCLQFEKN